MLTAYLPASRRPAFRDGAPLALPFASPRKECEPAVPVKRVGSPRPERPAPKILATLPIRALHGEPDPAQEEGGCAGAQVPALPAEATPAERLAALLHEADTPAGHVSPRRLAALLGLDLAEVAEQAGVHRNTIEHAPGVASVQRYVRQIYRVLAAAETLYGHRGHAVDWYRHERLSEFNGKTPEEVVRAGCPQVAVAYLERCAAGRKG